jgi:hypothetical protein
MVWEVVASFRVLATMAATYPHSLKALILHGLTPTAATILTTKLEEADAQICREENTAAPTHAGVYGFSVGRILGFEGFCEG